MHVLITAFEPYDRWSTNASWLALIEFTKELPSNVRVTTRRYPVDFAAVHRLLEKDLSANYDYALHLGQSPGSTCLRLESIGINVSGRIGEPAEAYAPLVADGPVAYRTQLPLGDWVQQLRTAGIPAQVSYHAGEYLCNATLYLSHHLAARGQLKTQSAFIHVPLDVSQVLSERTEMASLPSPMVAAGLRLIIDSLGTSRPQSLL